MSPDASGDMACFHCGLPVPTSLRIADRDEQFCCDGCRAVHALLTDEGLERYYALREHAAETGVPARITGRKFEELDSASFTERHVARESDGLLSTELHLEGVHCAACVWLVERLPRLADGVTSARLDLPRATCRVSWDPRRTSLSSVARRLDRLGYAPHPRRVGRLAELRRAEDRALLLRTGVAGAVAGNVMLLGAALHAGAFQGMAPAHEALFRWASLVVGGPATLWAALPLLRGALGALRARTLHVDLPVSLGLLVALAASAVNVVRGSGEIWLDSASALVFLLLAGRFLQRRAQRRATESSDLVAALTPARARLVEGEGPNARTREVPLESVEPGAVVEVHAGESIPIDGLVLEGESELDRSVLTGESRPEPVGPGASVHAGCVNEAAPIRVRVDACGEETRMGRLARLVEEAATRRAPVVELAHRVSGAFVAAVVALGVATVALWWRADPAAAVGHAVALLVITCPCALALATPLVMTSALGAAARRGLLVKSGAALEAAARPAVVFLDKTGTLTAGRLTLARWTGDEPALRLAAALERRGTHPVAEALSAAARDAGLDVPDAQDVVRVPGRGLRGRVEGHEVAVGSPAWVASSVANGDAPVLPAADRDGSTPVAVAVDGRLAAVATFHDTPRPDARETVRRLRATGARVEILSGDHPDAVAALARRVGLDAAQAHGGASPEDKLARVEREAATAGGPVLMVGDGVNDAAALAAATVGVAVSGGAEASLSAADVYVLREGVAPVAELVEGARRTLATVRKAISFSLAYNAVGATLAVAGLVHPLLAAVLMPLSSITVIAIAFRARTFPKESTAPQPPEVATPGRAAPPHPA